MTQINPADIFTKITTLAVLVFSLFGGMLLCGGALAAYDSAGRKEHLRQLKQLSGPDSCGFVRTDEGAWLWAVPPAALDETGQGGLHGPFVTICRTVGLPFVRVRAAIPERLFRGSLLTAVGRTVPASPENLGAGRATTPYGNDNKQQQVKALPARGASGKRAAGGKRDTVPAWGEGDGGGGSGAPAGAETPRSFRAPAALERRSGGGAGGSPPEKQQQQQQHAQLLARSSFDGPGPGAEGFPHAAASPRGVSARSGAALAKTKSRKSGRPPSLAVVAAEGGGGALSAAPSAGDLRPQGFEQHQPDVRGHVGPIVADTEWLVGTAFVHAYLHVGRLAPLRELAERQRRTALFFREFAQPHAHGFDRRAADPICCALRLTPCGVARLLLSAAARSLHSFPPFSASLISPFSPPPPKPPLSRSLVSKFKVLLSCGVDRPQWWDTARLWRLYLLADERGFWEPTDDLAVALQAVAGLPPDSEHIQMAPVMRWLPWFKAKRYEESPPPPPPAAAAAGKDGKAMSKGVKGSGGKGDAAAAPAPLDGACPFTEPSADAIRLSVPPLLRRLASESRGRLSAPRCWATLLCMAYLRSAEEVRFSFTTLSKASPPPPA